MFQRVACDSNDSSANVLQVAGLSDIAPQFSLFQGVVARLEQLHIKSVINASSFINHSAFHIPHSAFPLLLRDRLVQIQQDSRNHRPRSHFVQVNSLWNTIQIGSRGIDCSRCASIEIAPLIT